ncbi:TRAP transporter large permease subunit, partial [Vibrio splendidus]
KYAKRGSSIFKFNYATKPIGIATPPVGTALFVGCSVSGSKIENVIRSIMPFCAVLIVTLLAITFIPEISLALPRAFGLIN